jgi:NADPH:quinone reductase
MRAVVMTAVGGPEVLQARDLPEPSISGRHDVLVRLRAAGINPVDYKLRSHGTIGGALPAVLGWDGGRRTRIARWNPVRSSARRS